MKQNPGINLSPRNSRFPLLIKLLKKAKLLYSLSRVPNSQFSGPASIYLHLCVCWLGNESFRDAEAKSNKMSLTEIHNMKQKKQQPVPLGTLIGRELRSERLDKPTLKDGQAALAKKGEDYFLIKPDCERVPGNPSTSFSVFAIFDGHNGISAAIFAKENLLNNVLSAIPEGLGREEWLQALPRALVAGFVKTDIGFQQRGYGNFDIFELQEALRSWGLKDDTTCLVVDIIPSERPISPLMPKKKQNLLTSIIFGKRYLDSAKGTNGLATVGVVEDLFEEGSAVLAERLGKKLPLDSNPGLLRCAICQVDQPPSKGLSINSGPFFLCASCCRKKDAMEGKKFQVDRQ